MQDIPHNVDIEVLVTTEDILWERVLIEKGNVYIKSYSKNLVLIFKYTSDFRQCLPQEFQFDESNIRMEECLCGLK